MIVIRHLNILTSRSPSYIALFLALMIIVTNPEYGVCRTDEDSSPKYLNVQCDFERIPGGGCHLRESYCSLHTCICKPDFPINIADRLCIARHKAVTESCNYSQECQTGSYCAPSVNATRICLCKTGYGYSAKSKQCIKGLRGSVCRHDDECGDENQFCSLSTCDCMFGFEWFTPDEVCHKKSRHGEPCEQQINCKMHDEFSECEPHSRQCICGQFLSRRYALDEVTNRCVSCPIQRYHNATNTCLPEKLTVEYSLLDRGAHDRNSHQYVYMVLSMTPFVVFALIGFIYRYVAPGGTMIDNLSDLACFPPDDPVLTLSQQQDLEYSICVVPLDLNGNSLAHRPADSHGNIATLLATILPEPPPPYEVASTDLPPSYDQVVGRT